MGYNIAQMHVMQNGVRAVKNDWIPPPPALFLCILFFFPSMPPKSEIYILSDAMKYRNDAMNYRAVKQLKKIYELQAL